MQLHQDKAEELLEAYKLNFSLGREGTEKIWEAVSRFREFWEPETEDFAVMLCNALDKAGMLLNTRNCYAGNRICAFARRDPEAVRKMFMELYKENVPVTDRISQFIGASDWLLQKYGEEIGKKHYQNTAVISAYLFLRYPERYYLYTGQKHKYFSCFLRAGEWKTEGMYACVQDYYDLCAILLPYVRKDRELMGLYGCLSEERDLMDGRLHMLVDDLIRFGSKQYGGQPKLSQAKEEQLPAAFSKERFLREVYLEEEEFEALAGLLKNRKNIILQGAPGTGKTYAARQLAYALMGEKADGRIEFVQFHQNYAYEDFIMGYRPAKEGFSLQYGIFYRLCVRAAADPERDYFMIIDEINRGNISRIFGELLMLIEKEYRDTAISLAYTGEPFSVPGNLYLIGMMNTADRGLALMDYALRRRFGFFEMEPAFYKTGFQKYLEELDSEVFTELMAVVRELNHEIAADPALGEGFRIGHSYFCGQTVCTEEWISEVIEYALIPLLKEYWYDERQKVTEWSLRLRGVLREQR